MKKKLFIFVFIISFLFNINIVLASSTYTCTTEVAPDDSIECKVTIDSEPVIIESDGNINIFNLSGNRYSKLSSTKALFYESGTVTFGPANDKYSKYIISLYTEDGLQKYANDIRVSVVKKTTTTIKTTTTTTKKKSSNNYLSDIKLNGESIKDFSKTENRYYISYSNEIKKVTIDTVLEDENASVQINGPDVLEVGDNEYTIGVTSEDNTTRYYKILITRKEKEAELSSDTKLSNIKIKGYDLNFNKSSKTYHLTIDEDVNKLNITIKTNDENASYEITGNENLVDGSEIKIHVTAQNDDTDTYRIIITKESKISIVPYVILASILVLIIIIVVIVLIKKKKRKNNNNQVKNETNTKEIKNEKELEKTIEFNAVNNEKKSIEDDDTIIFNKDDE